MRTITLTFLLAFAITAIACSDSPSGPTGTAVLTVRLKDSPFSDAQALLVTFSAESAHRADGGFSPVAFAGGATSRTCDLKRLVTADDVLGTTALPAGHYTQIRLAVSAAALYFDNPSTGPACAPAIAVPAGRTDPVSIPSGEVRLNRQFTLEADTMTTILLDFDGDASVHATGTGEYTMTPVIGIVSVQ
jgi:hypothetical protein